MSKNSDGTKCNMTKVIEYYLGTDDDDDGQ